MDKDSPELPVYTNAPGAPFVYFDSVFTFGTMYGAVEVELTARVIIPGKTNSVNVTVCTGHLRCSKTAAVALRDALSKAIDVMQHQHQPGDPQVVALAN